MRQRRGDNAGLASSIGEAMKTRHWMQIAALASALGLAGSAVAADAGATTAQMQTGPSPGGSVQQAIPPGPASVGGSERIDNSNGVPLHDWARTYAQEHGGHLPPAVVIDEAGQSWDEVGVESGQANDQDAPRVIMLRPHGERIVVLSPDNDRVVYVEPDGTRVLYLTPEDQAIPEDEIPPPSAGGMQATPGYDGPGSAKGQ
jgi:hypothetical protein